MADDNNKCKGFNGNDCKYNGVLLKRKACPRAILCMNCKREKKNIARCSKYKKMKMLMASTKGEKLSCRSKGLDGGESSGYPNKNKQSAKKPKPEPATVSEVQPTSSSKRVVSTDKKQEPEATTTPKEQAPVYWTKNKQSGKTPKPVQETAHVSERGCGASGTKAGAGTCDNLRHAAPLR